MSVGMLLGGRYELRASLGQGGFGTVWRAHDQVLGRDVAVKLITLDTARPGTREEIAERFEREARAVAALNHPNIVIAHDYGVEGETAYLVMELILGDSLQDQLAERARGHLGGLDPRRVVAIAMEICAGLSAAHAAGLIHRDLKPANVMIAADGGHAKIVDFGIARVADKSRITHTGAYLGTLRYTSPEQMGAGPVDPRSDLYSLGCLLFEMVAGRSPYTAETPLQWMAAHQYVTPVSLRTYAPAAPGELESLIAEMLAKAPDGRPANAVEVRERLAKIRFDPAPAPPVVPAQPAAARPTAYGRPASAPPVPGTTPPAVNSPAPPRYPAAPSPAYASPSHPSPYPPIRRSSGPGLGGGYPPPTPAWPVAPGRFVPPPPPSTLVAAARFLQLTAVLTGVLLLCYLIGYHRVAAEWRVAFAHITRGSDEPALGLVLVLFGAVAQIVAAVVLAGSVRRGNPVARVLAWIFIVVNLLCCFATFTSSSAFTPESSDYSTSDRRVIDAASGRFADAFPGWLTAMTVIVAVAGMLALIAAASMMSRRPSVAYFRAMSAMRIRR
jgi:eukaryotic-like serine/threonine-protein kinase